VYTNEIIFPTAGAFALETPVPLSAHMLISGTYYFLP
jgi:hypothetical protein